MTFSEYVETEDFYSNLFDRLFPILRSITGPGLRESYSIFGEYMDFSQSSIASGTKLFDWTVPQEWHCEEAYLLGPNGEKIVDMRDLNLHVLNYSQPIDTFLSLNELQGHLYSKPSHPNAVPYVTSYYSPKWGFCLSDEQRRSLPDGTYHAVIKSSFIDGSVDIVQTTLKGCCSNEILLSSYLCHPSMANNELSGPLVLLGLYHRLQKWERRNHTFRFLLCPETIGTLCFLHGHQEHLRKHIKGGMILNMLGGNQPKLTYCFSKNQDGVIDKALRHISRFEEDPQTVPFIPSRGSDERQYASPGFQFPVLNVTRDFFSGFDGYHTSLDNKAYMGIPKLIDAMDQLEKVLLIADNCVSFENLQPFGEPHLGPRGLYPNVSYVDPDMSDAKAREQATQELHRIKMLLAYSDGHHDTLDIANLDGVHISKYFNAMRALRDSGLLKIDT